jgi:hypothetical protein
MAHRIDKPRSKMTLEVLLLTYWVASFLHFIQDAEYARVYPLSGWDSIPVVYITWIAISAFGLLGYLIHRSPLQWVGQVVLCLYAVVGMDALFHYTRAPFSAYSRAMNITIWLEVVVAGILLAYLLATTLRPPAR